MNVRTAEQLREKIHMTIVQEINVINIIAQEEMEKCIPRFIENLTQQIHELVVDEIRFRNRSLR